MNNGKNGQLGRLFAAARRFEPDTYGLENNFEHRLMARIRESRSQVRTWFLWQRRLTPALVLLAVILSIVSWYVDAHRSQDLISFLIGGRDFPAVVTNLTGAGYEQG